MRMVVAMVMSPAARMLVRVGMARGVGMRVHRCLTHSTSLPSRKHPEVSSCYWNFDNKASEFVDAPTHDCHYHTRADGQSSSAHVRGIQAPRRDR